MTETINLICFTCKHFGKGGGACAAFDEIPDNILRTNKHSKPLPGQLNNLVYEFDPDKKDGIKIMQ